MSRSPTLPRPVLASLWPLGRRLEQTTDPNNFVAVANPDAMPVILRTPEEIEIWMTAPWEEAQKLRRPLRDGVLQIVSIGNKEDPPEAPPALADPQPSLF